MQFNIQLKDSEFSGVCERLLRNHILLDSVESTGIKVFQYLGTEAEKLWSQAVHVFHPYLKCACTCMTVNSGWRDLAGVWQEALVEVCHWSKCMPRVAPCSQCNLWQTASEVLSKHVCYGLSRLCLSMLLLWHSRQAKNILVPELWFSINSYYSNAVLTVLVPQHRLC